MKNEFIPYEEALAMKELGFDEPCLGCYDEKSVFGLTVMSIKKYYTNSKEDTWNCAAPLYQQAFRWFRKEYDLYHVITVADLGKYESGNPDFQCAIYSKDPVLITNMDKYNTYEEAELVCLKDE
jgi:hypothetical protein